MGKGVKGIFFIFFVLIFLLAPASLQAALPLHHDLAPATGGAYQYGLYGYDNPAALIYLLLPDLYFTFSNQ